MFKIVAVQFADYISHPSEKHHLKDSNVCILLDLSLENSVIEILIWSMPEPNLTRYMKKVFKLSASFHMIVYAFKSWKMTTSAYKLKHILK